MKFGDMEYSGGSNFVLSENKTVNLLTSDSTTEKQAKIDAVPKVASGDFTCTFQFADGTHTESVPLTFSGFTYPIVVQGNSGESGLHTNQAAIVSVVAISDNGIEVTNCMTVSVKNLKINNDSSGSYKGIYVVGCANIDIDGCYLNGNGTSVGQGIWIEKSLGRVKNNYFTSNNVGIWARNSFVVSWANDDTSTLPAYGITADLGSTVGKSSTQPAGSSANESVSGGAVIR